MVVEVSRRGLVSILIVSIMVLLMIVIITTVLVTTPVLAAKVITYPVGTIDVVQGQTFTLRHRLAWDDPANPGYYLSAIWWDYSGDDVYHFTLDSVAAYFDNGDLIDATVSTKDNGTCYSLAVTNAVGDWRDGEFTVDITLRASGPDNTPHAVRDNHTIYYTILQSLESVPPATVTPAPVTVRVLDRSVPGAISPGQNDNGNWSPSFSENQFENVAPDEDGKETSNVTIPENAEPCIEENITDLAAVTDTSLTDNTVSSSVSRKEWVADENWTKIRVSEDTFVREWLAESYGACPSLAVSIAGDRAWLKFDLSGIPPGVSITQAKLYLHIYGEQELNDPDGIFSACGASVDWWGESWLTWKLQPEVGEAIDNRRCVVGWNAWDVTSFISSEHAGDGVASICIKVDESRARLALHGNVFDSKEASGDMGPYLEVYFE